MLSIRAFVCVSTYDSRSPLTPVVLINRRLWLKSAEYVDVEFPCTVLKDEISTIVLTEFHWVEPFPFEIKMNEEGMNPFWGDLAYTVRTWRISVSSVREVPAILIRQLNIMGWAQRAQKGASNLSERSNEFSRSDCAFDDGEE